MDNVTFKYAPRIKPKYLDHLVSIGLSTLDWIIGILIVRFLLGYDDDVTIWVVVISGLLFSILFEFLFSFGKTTIDFCERRIIYSPALTCPTINIKIDEIESIQPYKHWYDRRNLTVKTATGKKHRISVDDFERFVALLIKENNLIQSTNLVAK